VSDEYNPLQDFDPSRHTPDDYAAMHRNTGHICCQCVNQTPPLPCCNPGHAEAMVQAEKFRRIIEEDK
jgi:hypothetical protein